MELFYTILTASMVLVRSMTGDQEDELAMDMLKKYQYMGENSPDPAMRGDESFKIALMNFQNFAGMNETGELDNSTMRKLTAPRCGLPDITDTGSLLRRRRKRYSLTGARWAGVIGYNFKSYSQSSSLTPYAIRTQVKSALNEWKRHTARLEFKQFPDSSDLEISFERGDHGDGRPLDGNGQTLAHAFYPSRAQIGGDIHFDDDEKWTIRDNEGTDLYFVALHELGHSLGLQHSSVEDAVMHPFYPGYISNLALSQDDIQGIQAVYGAASRTREYPTPPPTDDTDTWKQTFCETGTVDAAGILNRIIFIFQGDLYAVLDESGIRPGYPRKIQDDWEDLPTDLDSALGLGKYNELLLFKGDQYWRYTWNNHNTPHLVSGYPHMIQADFTKGLPLSIDAAFTWSDNGKIYALKDGKYNRIRSNLIVTAKRIKAKPDRWYYKHPQDFRANWNVEEEVSDVLMYEGRTFFFTGNKYIRYNDNQYKPDQGYPRRTAEAWFGCKSTGSHKPVMEMMMMVNDTQFDEIKTTMNRTYSDTSASSHTYCTIRSLIFTLLLIRCIC